MHQKLEKDDPSRRTKTRMMARAARHIFYRSYMLYVIMSKTSYMSNMTIERFIY